MIGELISAGANLLGGFFNREGQSQANQLAIQDKERDRALQREFAQSGIQWKVEDAKKAGIHPLFALGGNTATYTPSSVSIGSTSMGDDIARSGQDIGRAINATRTAEARDDAYTAAVKALTLRKGGLENDLLAAQIAKLKASQNPAMPAATDNKAQAIPGQPATLDRKKPEDVTGLVMGGRQWPTNKNFSDAQEYENRYGDIAENVFGVGNLIADIGSGLWHGGQRWRAQYDKKKPGYRSKRDNPYRW